MVGNLKGHARRKVYFCQKNRPDRLEEKAVPLVLHSHCYETNTASEMWQMWKLYTGLPEFYKQPSTVKVQTIRETVSSPLEERNGVLD